MGGGGGLGGTRLHYLALGTACPQILHACTTSL